MNGYFNPMVSEEALAAWMDGNVTPAQDAYISQLCSVDPDMREIMAADSQIEEYYNDLTENGFSLPEELLGDFVLPEVEDYEHIELYPDDDVELYPDDDDYDSTGDSAASHDGVTDDYDAYSHDQNAYDDYDL